MADLTGLDRIGIPVWAAVRPASATLSVWHGKGAEPIAARVSAIMEAIESYCAESTSLPVTRARYRDLRREEAIDPDRLPRRSGTPPVVDAEQEWVCGLDLASGASVHVPLDCVIANFSTDPPAKPGALRSGTNGLASGNDRSEAILHALCELVERDACAIWRARTARWQSSRRLGLDDVCDESCREALDRYKAARIAVVAYDVTSEISIPTFLVFIDDRKGEPPFLGQFHGSGCHPRSEIALFRALSEAAQSRLTFIAGARDDLSDLDYRLIDWERHISSILSNLPENRGPRRMPAGHPDWSITENVELVLERLAECGFRQAVAVDLSVPTVPVPVVRLLVPGLEGHCFSPEYRAGERAIRAGKR